MKKTGWTLDLPKQQRDAIREWNRQQFKSFAAKKSMMRGKRKK